MTAFITSKIKHASDAISACPSPFTAVPTVSPSMRRTRPRDGTARVDGAGRRILRCLDTPPPPVTSPPQMRKRRFKHDDSHGTPRTVISVWSMTTADHTPTYFFRTRNTQSRPPPHAPIYLQRSRQELSFYVAHNNALAVVT
jgi:hypothetical protein